MNSNSSNALDPASIVEVAIYPPLGIARVGNARGDSDYFTAAEVIGGAPADPGALRDVNGAIKRQAVRFRIYATLASGQVRELTLNDGIQIQWRVAIANLKAGWYEFTNALDLPDGLAKPAVKRNAETSSGRFRLDITPPPQSIEGRGVSGAGYIFEGQFFDKTVYLGELRTDPQGRLLFLGGHGRAAPRWAGTKPTTFANNSLWFDDVADGTVRAHVTVGGKSFEATPGYVSVAPPNYAPGLFGVVTMDDVVRDMFAAEGWLELPPQTSFTRDVWPIFSRLTAMQWVNHGLFMAHGFGSPLDARNPKVLKRLTDTSHEGRAWREAVFGLFRDPAVGGATDRSKLPYLYGDAYDGGSVDHARVLLAVTSTMYRHLAAWAKGDFINDWQGEPLPPHFDELTPSAQIEHLSRAPLHECLGGPFHPGIELTWIMRRASLWAGPYRLNVLDEEGPARQDFGPELTPEICLGADGPLRGVAPGALTRWLGVPWHTDEASCLSDFEYSPSTYLSMPSYWGARVPNQVLSAEAWSRAVDEASFEMQKLKHATYREDWTRDINGRNYYERIDNMVKNWCELGMVLPTGTPTHLQALGLPEIAHVENGRHPDHAGSNDKVMLMAAIERLASPTPSAVKAMGLTQPGQSRPPRRTYHRGEI
ncbi:MULTISPECIES: LodA/GoxA family CTQ-dependent oxidase [Burkholderiaceae]|uniref:LodA/GoxA family CTQ-dependent oxidase n=1 Tax=Burkholderiaceae TaxID=119060 RepID=UPI00095B60B6|nr:MULTISPECIES: LodA/GoxA family CTQ-dependent oxidase [Burkholderiaceae]MCG1018532.1 LodA/GoxA family CTQ-dependent oxidase [Mycetohabitans sp. B4]SIT79511.1 hypothetical protein SAMN04487768_0266 [Burkholderia sp. b13]